MNTIAQPTPLVEPEERLFAHPVRQHRGIAATLAALAEMRRGDDDLAELHRIEREADGRPRRSRRHSA